MQNWYQNFIKTAQVPTSPAVTDEAALNERINAVTNQLKNQVFPDFTNAMGLLVFNSGINKIEPQIEIWLNQIPDILGIQNYNRELIRPILRDLAADAAQVVVENRQPDAWRFINMHPDIVQRYITRFTTAYTPSDQELEPLKLTMMQK